jgi:hypothetical protein
LRDRCQRDTGGGRIAGIGFDEHGRAIAAKQLRREIGGIVTTNCAVPCASARAPRLSSGMS